MGIFGGIKGIEIAVINDISRDTIDTTKSLTK